ncbi:hypothetical protein L873DRAFT_362237 [Choiromyces venosus 120613-1]|uniref:Aminotransferase class V domain-containing protein n=1 Tax=Choiromyces venosus 120613-1 TaxID=1336337 RepID=A0A3N4K2R0_9PEZI|nr:hypothetical protein L873DRAFT_362237 [Choiromyces venosus 120613-1]
MKEVVAAGGLANQEDAANRKVGKIYAAVARALGIFKVVPREGTPSRMNICVRAQPAEFQEVFLKGAGERGLLVLKGHRSVAGIRISNCMPCFTSLLSCILWLTWNRQIIRSRSQAWISWFSTLTSLSRRILKPSTFLGLCGAAAHSGIYEIPDFVEMQEVLLGMH